MRSPEQVIWDLVQGWLKKAEEDFHVTGELMERDPAPAGPTTVAVKITDMLGEEVLVSRRLD